MAGVAFLASTTQAARITTGTQDFTVTGIGTPKGVIVIMSGGTTDGSSTNTAGISIGFADGTNRVAVGIRSLDNQADSDTSRAFDFTKIIALPNPAGTANTFAADFDSWITDGVRINVTTADSAYYIQVIFICGPDAQVKVGNFDMSDHTGTPNQTLDVTGCGFDPNLAFFLSCVNIAGLSTGGLNVSQSAAYSFGLAVADETGSDPPNGITALVSWTHRDARTTSQPSFFSQQQTQGVIATGFVGAASGALTKQAPVNFDVFITDGFRVKDVAGADPPVAAYVAIRMDGISMSVSTKDFDPANSSESISKANPGSAFVMSTSADATGDKTDSQNSGVAFGIITAFGQSSIGYWEQDAVSTMNSGSFASIDTVVFNLNDTGGSGLDYTGTINPGASGNFTFTKGANTYGTSRKQFVLILARPIITISPSGIASAEAFGNASVQQLQTVSPSGIASAEAFGTASLATTISVLPTGIASEEAFGTPALALGTYTISPSGIASAEAFGTPALSTTITLLPGGIASAEAFGTPTLTLGVVTVSPSGITSAEAFGTPTLTLGVVTVSPSGIASAEAFGTPTLTTIPFIFPTGIPSEEAFGTATVLPGSVTVLVQGIASEEAFGTPGVSITFNVTLVVEGIASEEAFGFPFVRGGFIPVTLKKKIRDALVDAAKLGTFIEATYDKDLNEIIQGLQVAPSSIEANEITSRWVVDDDFGRDFVQDRQFWPWLLILRFETEVIAERFERALEDTPICIKRDPTEDRQVHVLLVDAQYTHPPRQSSSNGTEIRYRLQAELSRR